MIESLAIGFFGASILFTVLAIEEESILYSMLSFFFWIMTGVGVLAVNRAGEIALQTEYGLSIPFIIIGLVMAIYTAMLFFDWKKEGKFRL